MIRSFPGLKVIALSAALTCVALPGMVRQAVAYGSGSSFTGGYYNSRGAYVPVRYKSNTGGYYGSTCAPSSNSYSWDAGGYNGSFYSPSSTRSSWGTDTQAQNYQPPIYGTLGAGTGFVQPYMRYNGTVVPGHYTHRRSAY